MIRFIQAVLFTTLIFAHELGYTHSGGTDSSGGHYNRATGEYHHHGGGRYQSSKPFLQPKLSSPRHINYKKSSLETDSKETDIAQIIPSQGMIQVMGQGLNNKISIKAGMNLKELKVSSRVSIPVGPLIRLRFNYHALKYIDVYINSKLIAPNTKVESIIIHNPSFETDKGIKVGDSKFQVRKTYGDPAKLIPLNRDDYEIGQFLLQFFYSHPPSQVTRIRLKTIN